MHFWPHWPIIWTWMNVVQRLIHWELNHFWVPLHLSHQIFTINFYKYFVWIIYVTISHRKTIIEGSPHTTLKLSISYLICVNISFMFTPRSLFVYYIKMLFFFLIIYQSDFCSLKSWILVIGCTTKRK